MNKIPTLYEWMGGTFAFENLTQRFYDKVLQDDLLAPVFGNLSAEHAKHVAHFIAEVFGGPRTYSQEEGSHYKMIVKHFGKQITEEQRQHWIQLLLATADEIGIPDYPEFRSALVAYLEWGTRIAKLNSHTSELAISPDQPMPSWSWGEAKGPFIK